MLAVVSGPEQVSPNGRVQLVQVAFSGDSRDERVQDAVGALRERAAPLFAGTGLVAGLTGDAAIVVDRADAYSSGELIVGVATVVLILVLLTAVFRSPIAALVPLLVVGLVFLIANALIAVVANALDFEVADTLTSLLIVVLFGIGTDYILFLLFRFRERLREGEPARDAVAHAVARVGEPIGSAALTVAVAFAALLLAKLGLFSSMAPGLIIAVLVAVLAALTLVPAILALLGPRIFWPSKAWQKAPEATRYRGLGEWVAAHPWNAAISSGVALLALAASALHYTADYDTLSSLPADTESAQAFEDLRSGFPAGALNPTQVYVTGDEPLGVEDLRPIGDALRGVDGIASVAPPSLSPDGRTALIAASLEPSPFANEALDLAEGPLRDAAHAAAGQVGAQALVGGQTAALADMRDAVNGDMLLIFPVAAGMIFLILLLLLRSVLAPLTLMIAVALGFAATLGFAVIVFQGIAGESGTQLHAANVPLRVRRRDRDRLQHPPHRAPPRGVPRGPKRARGRRAGDRARRSDRGIGGRDPRRDLRRSDPDRHRPARPVGLVDRLRRVARRVPDRTDLGDQPRHRARPLDVVARQPPRASTG